MIREHHIIHLNKFVQDKYAFGNEDGRDVYKDLSEEVSAYPDTKVFGISLKGIQQTDASFARESVISLAKSLRGEKGFFLIDFSSQDLRDNWDYAAKAKEQPVIVLNEKKYEVIGPPINAGNKELLDFIMKEGTVTTSKIAEKFSITAPNASAKLKKLYMMGLILGQKEAAETGGIEYVYTAIK